MSIPRDRSDISIHTPDQLAGLAARSMASVINTTDFQDNLNKHSKNKSSSGSSSTNSNSISEEVRRSEHFIRDSQKYSLGIFTEDDDGTEAVQEGTSTAQEAALHRSSDSTNHEIHKPKIAKFKSSSNENFVLQQPPSNRGSALSIISSFSPPPAITGTTNKMFTSPLESVFSRVDSMDSTTGMLNEKSFVKYKDVYDHKNSPYGQFDNNSNDTQKPQHNITTISLMFLLISILIPPLWIFIAVGYLDQAYGKIPVLIKLLSGICALAVSILAIVVLSVYLSN